MLMIFLLSAITLLVCVSQVVGFRRLYQYVEAELRFTPGGGYTPKVAVILPCKGLDPGFQGNIKQLLEQDYSKPGETNSKFEVIFAVASQDDPAYPVLVDIVRNSSVKSQIVVAGPAVGRAQKINNQLAALKHISDDVEVLVFVDSDMIARRDFLRYLVARLENDAIGVTTGYRFYIPFSGQPAALLRSLWNRMSAWEMANPQLSFAWGGAMAIRRQVFVRGKVVEHWDRSADDDLALTTAVRKMGLRVHFVPQCLVASNGDGTIAEIVEWTNRQLILTKVYFPRLWRRAIARASVMAVWLLAMLISTWGAYTGDPTCLLATLVGLTILPIELFFLVKAQHLWQRVLSDKSSELEESFGRFCLALPLAHIFLPWMTLYSVLSNRIQWRGVSYELRGPSDIVVVSNS